MKQTIGHIIDPITHIMNLSLTSGEIPENMKITKTIPIHKSGDKDKLNNYRSISLLPAFSKILEKFMYNRITNFLEKNELFYMHQYGFRKKHSTMHPILQLLNKIYTEKDNNTPKQCMGIFIDISKAFDTLSHKILLSKLNRYGIRGVAYNWLKNYLINRKQFVEIDSTRSSLRNITCGVPQGSILGPLLFLIYINNISLSTTNAHILSYADDTTLLITGENINSLYLKDNDVLKELETWLKSNKLVLNAQKSKYIIFKGPKNTEDRDLYINNITLEQITANNSIKFLGVNLDEKLSWKKHLNYLNSKLAMANFSLNRVKHQLPKTTMLQLYYTLIYPHLLCNITIWGNANQSDISKTITLQKNPSE